MNSRVKKLEREIKRLIDLSPSCFVILTAIHNVHKENNSKYDKKRCSRDNIKSATEKIKQPNGYTIRHIGEILNILIENGFVEKTEKENSSYKLTEKGTAIYKKTKFLFNDIDLESEKAIKELRRTTKKT